MTIPGTLVGSAGGNESGVLLENIPFYGKNQRILTKSANLVLFSLILSPPRSHPQTQLGYRGWSYTPLAHALGSIGWGLDLGTTYEHLQGCAPLGTAFRNVFFTIFGPDFFFSPIYAYEWDYFGTTTFLYLRFRSLSGWSKIRSNILCFP